MREVKVNPKMSGLTAGSNLPRFYEMLGRDAEFAYGATQWTPELATLVRGGLLPIAVLALVGLWIWADTWIRAGQSMPLS